MRHPAQKNYELNRKLATIMRESMERNKVLPKDPRRNKKFRDWLEKNGCKVGPISKRSILVFELAGFVGIWIECNPMNCSRKPPRKQWKKKEVIYKVHIDIPNELADNMLALGFGP